MLTERNEENKLPQKHNYLQGKLFVNALQNLHNFSLQIQSLNTMRQIFSISSFPEMWQPIYECHVSSKINSYIPCNFPLMYTHSLFTVFLLLISIFKQSPSESDAFFPLHPFLLQLNQPYSMDPHIKRCLSKLLSLKQWDTL